MDAKLIQAIKLHPGVLAYISHEHRREYFKAAPIPRDEMERILSRAILKVDRAYLRVLEEGGGRVPWDFWSSYEADLRKEIATPLRGYIEQSFSNYSDYVNFIDKTGAVDDINTAMTDAINKAAKQIRDNTEKRLNALIGQGLSPEQIIENIALRFSSGHAEQIAITELTRAEAQFSEALSARLGEQGVNTVIRWLTSEDEKVCPICNPLDHKPKKDGGWMSNGSLIDGPPAHPNCRCQTVVDLTR